MRAQRADARAAAYLVDMSHVEGRSITGIERISLELFTDEALPGITLRRVLARGRWSMIVAQTLRLPLLAMKRRSAMVLCPGFPPSVPLMAAARDRVVACIHDLFLLTHGDTLSLTARRYMRPSFRFCIRHGRRFIVFSETMRGELRAICSPDAEIALYRPKVRNVFGVASTRRADPPLTEPLHILTVGTIEPRKNYPEAAAICTQVAEITGRPATLHIVGRPGWGGEAERVSALPNVVVHGYLGDEAMRALVARSHLFFYPTRAEGLGLPVLELQFSGLPVVANDLPILRETLGDSAVFVDVADAASAAAGIVRLIETPGEMAARSQRSLDNIARWNALAEADRSAMARTLLEWHATVIG